jgi:hypothetical protein
MSAVRRTARAPFSNRRIFKYTLAAFVVLTLLPYAWGPVYRFPEPARFSGSSWWNPYERLGGTWQRANLHAHGRAWVGLTNGEQPDIEVVQRYRDLGYDIAGVSDYQKIAAYHGIPTMPLYEHGYSLAKSHQVAIGAQAVEWFDFPFFQFTSHKQYVINRVKQKAALVGLAHPASRDAYTAEDLEQLTGYDLIEIVNGPFAVLEGWDAALSAGHPVWAMANDDTHDITDPHRTAAGWNMIDAPTTNTVDIVDALASGRSYAVLRTGALDSANLTRLDNVRLQNATLTVSVSGLASTFEFIGQDGVLRATMRDTLSATYPLSNADSYVRTVVTTPQTTLYLNPVIRYDGNRPAAPVATVDIARTWMLRGSIALGALAAAGLGALRRRRSASLIDGVLAAASQETA